LLEWYLTRVSLYSFAKVVNEFLNKDHLKEMEGLLQLPAPIEQGAEDSSKWVHHPLRYPLGIAGEPRWKNESELSTSDHRALDDLQQGDEVKTTKRRINS